jgi:predicted MFS family arabinose efflux permease
MFTTLKKIRNHNIILVFAVAFAMFVDSMSYGIVIPLLPIFSDKILMLNNSQISFFVASYAIGLLTFVPFLSYITSIFSNKNTLLLGSIILVISTLLFPICYNYELLLFSRFLQGASAAITWTSGLSLIAENVKPQHRSTALATSMVGVSVGHLLGAPFAGFLYELGGLYLPFLGVILFGLVSILFILTLQPITSIIYDTRKYKNFGFFKLCLNSHILKALTIIVLLESFMLSFLEPNLSLFAARNFNASSETIGLLFGTQVLALGLFSPVAAKISEHYKKLPTILFGLFLSGIVFILMSLAHSINGYFVLMAMLGITSALCVSPVLSAFADELDKSEMRGLYHTAYGFFNLIYSIGMLAGPITGYITNELLPYYLSYILVGFTLIFSVTMLIFYLNSKQSQRGYTQQQQSTKTVHPLESSQDKSQDFSTTA